VLRWLNGRVRFGMVELGIEQGIVLPPSLLLLLLLLLLSFVQEDMLAAVLRDLEKEL